MVVNAGCADKDIDHFNKQLSTFKGDVKMEVVRDEALIALQGK
jgi:glycine cleavage system aminomethyltransferase T